MSSRQKTAGSWFRKVGWTAIAVACIAAPPLLGPASTPNAARAAEDTEQVPAKVEAAVDKALAWLAKNQRTDGSWPGGTNSTTAVPALATKAFLARGHVPGQGPYGENINRAIDYILSQQQADGLISGANGNAVMYEHGISCSMLGEAYGMVDDTRKNKIEKALAKAVKLTLDAQAIHKNSMEQGGWRYTRTTTESDISVTGWQLMSLRAAANCGASVPKDALVAGREYVRRCVAAGGFSYQAGKGNPGSARTGTAIVSLEMLGDHNSKEAKDGGDFLLEHPISLTDGEYYYYGVYYVSQALYHLGDKYYERGYPRLRDELLANQGPEGTWPSAANSNEQAAGEAYRTSMAVLALCVPYRYLPLFQR